jgi:hypothetical protein
MSEYIGLTSNESGGEESACVKCDAMNYFWGLFISYKASNSCRLSVLHDAYETNEVFSS